MTSTAPLTGDAGRSFALAGNAIFTVSNPQGTRYTFCLQRAKHGINGGEPPVFAKFLTGPDNTSDYTYLGMVVEGPVLSVRATSKSPANAAKEHTPFRVLVFALRILSGAQALPEGYAIHHEGRCGRCGRRLTVPESIESGLGPECAGKV